MTPKHTHMIQIPGSYRAPVPEAKLVERSDPQKQIQISIYARPNPGKHATALATHSQDSALPVQREYLSRSQFEQIYGADPEDLDRIAKWAKRHKLRVVDSSVPMRRVRVEGTIASVSSAFQIQLNEYEHPQLGHFRGREGYLHVPEDLHGVIAGVFGLDNRPIGHPRRRRSRALPI